MAVTDLTGTRWQLNAIPEVNNTSFNVYGSVEGLEGFTRIMHQFASPGASVTFSNGGTQSQPMVFYGTGANYLGWYHKGRGSIGSATFTPLATPPIIKFVRGNDVTNTNLIAWVQANATQLHAGNFSFGYLPIANMYFGTQQVKKVYLGNTLVWEKEN